VSGSGGAAGFELVLLAAGGVLTLVVIGIFAFVLTRQDKDT
jgi:hypothetical protein